MLGRLKPDVLLLDLRMPAHQDFTVEFVKSQLASSTSNTIAISFAVDQESQSLGESYGLNLLLDKMKFDGETSPRHPPNRSSEPSVRPVASGSAERLRKVASPRFRIGRKLSGGCPTRRIYVWGFDFLRSRIESPNGFQ
jgi:hypothetical protein